MSTDQATSLFQIDVRHWLRSEHAHGPFPSVSEPYEVACYSRDEDGRVSIGSRHKLRKYVQPPENADLNEGYDTFVGKRNDDTGIENVIRALKTENPLVFENHCDIITYRNNLNKIGKTPLSQRDEWELDCCQINNKIMLDIRMTDTVDPNTSNNEQWLKSMYQGYKFEALCTNEPRSEPVDANGEFCSITKLQLGHHNIIVSSEIDCTLLDQDGGDQQPVTRNYVELKTIKAIRHSGDLNSLYRYRYPKFWLQSFLAGVSNIVLGQRNVNGTLADVKTVDTFNLPAEADQFFQSQRSRSWDPATMVNFIDLILDEIRQVSANHPASTIRVIYNSRDCCVRAFVVNGPESGLAERLGNLVKP